MSFLGIDIGTSSIKVVHIDVDKKIEILQSISIAYNKDRLPSRRPKYWWDKLQQALSRIRKADHIQAIGMTGQMHSLIMEDASGYILDPVSLWFDMDGHKILNDFVENEVTDFHNKMGNLPLADFTLAKWLSAKSKNRKLIQKVKHYYCAKDFIRSQMDQDALYIVDYNEAAGMQLLHPFSQKWDKQLCDAAEIDINKLPQIVDARSIGGYSSSIKGLKDHIPIIVGAGDQAAAARAVGAFKPGVASLSLGTSGVISIAVSRSEFSVNDIKGFHLFPMGFDDIYQIIGTIPALGKTLLWLSKLFNKDLAEIDQIASHHNIDVSCVFSPYLEGKGSPYPDNKKRASLQNIAFENSSKDVIQSVYNGLAHEFYEIIQHIRNNNIAINKIVISGGAAAFPALIQRINRYMDIKVVIADNPDASAIGAALLAFDALYPHRNIYLESQEIHNQTITNGYS